MKSEDLKMNYNQIFEIIKEKVIETLDSDNTEVNEESNISQLGVSSIAYVKLLIFIEEEFDIMFDDDDLLMSDDITVKELAKKIESLII